MTQTIHVLGDTGGHTSPLLHALNMMGVDIETRHIPSDIKIIHLGDLIHKGPGSNTIVKFVNEMIQNNPGQWIQILGNHEFQHIEGAPYFWRCDCSMETINIINEWWENQDATTTYAIQTPKHIQLDIAGKINQPNTSILFSHAGLTRGWWNRVGQPADAIQTSQQLNLVDVEYITSAGSMLGVNNPNPGPVWAVGNTEVFQSWVNQPEPMPFTQIHGHTSSYRWVKGEWWNKTKHFQPFRENTKLNPETRAVITNLSQNLLIGLDPGFSIKADIPVQPSLRIQT